MISAETLDEVRARLPCSLVVGRYVKLKRAGREWRGLSPFNKERSPSFFVNDAKAAWFDFSANKSGDIFAFLMEKEGLSFSEAVERLAAEAGVSLRSDPEAIQREARRLTLIEELERDQRDYRAGIGAAADYLVRRGVTPEVADRFGLGYSKLGRFAGRLTVPIRDMAGKIVGFGARALGGEQPKYLNSPETKAFKKGTLLYNADRARQLAHEGEQLVVVEGYADVWSVDPFFPCVATMGTSVTEQQLLGMWRLHQSPCVLFDGDAAGRRAIAKVIATAFPLLLPGRGLKFASLPSGLDPDDCCRNSAYGPDALRRAVGASEPLSGVWWRLCRENASTGTPEALAAMEKAVLGPASRIPDEGLRKWFIADMKDRLRSLNRRPAIVRANGQSHHSANPGSIRLVHGPGSVSGFSLREATLVAKLAQHPEAVTEGDLEAKGVSQRTRLLIAEIASLIGTVPAEELEAVLHAGNIGVAVEEAEQMCERAGITSLRRTQ